MCAFRTCCTSPSSAVRIRALLKSLDISAARQAAGVVDVITGAEVRELGNVPVAPFVPDVKQVRHPLLVDEEARYTGEPVVAILADDPMRARDAADLVEAEWDALPAVSAVE